MKSVPASGLVLLIGDLAADIITTIPEETPAWRSMTPPAMVRAGGTVGNTAIALAKLGVPCAVLSATGSDAFGDFVRNQLVSEGVDLPPWHHLICGDRQAVHDAGISQSGRMLSEDSVAEDDWEEHLIFRAG